MKIKGKINWTKIIRRAVQLAAFILAPGLFISVFAAIKNIYMAAIAGTFTFSAYLPQVLILVAVIPLTVVMGRFFCGFLCSFGSLGDFIWSISARIRKKKVNISERADGILKYFKYVLLLFLAVFVWTLGAVSISSDMNPWSIFGMYTSLSAWGNLAGFLSIGGALLLLILVGSFFVERFFCRYMCPLGAIFAIVSKIRLFKISKPTKDCGSCRICTRNCSMGIDLYKNDTVKSSECIDCMECIPPCPKENVQARFAGGKVVPIAAGLVISAGIAVLYLAGSVVSRDAYAAQSEAAVVAAQETTELLAEAEESGIYIDGVYTGSAAGYRGTTTVEVTVENGYIMQVEVLSTDDDEEFFTPVEEAVIPDILQTQGTDVDVVTGATYSTYAITDAVEDALKDAVKSGYEMESMTTTPEATPTPESTDLAELTDITENVDLSDIADGVYTGTGTGFNGEMTVEVTVAGGVIEKVEIISTNDDRPYLDRAESVIDEVIQEQDVDVDTVSGATYSSDGILEAVANALGLDYEKTVSSAGGGHKRGGGNH